LPGSGGILFYLAAVPAISTNPNSFFQTSCHFRRRQWRRRRRALQPSQSDSSSPGWGSVLPHASGSLVCGGSTAPGATCPPSALRRAVVLRRCRLPWIWLVRFRVWPVVAVALIFGVVFLLLVWRSPSWLINCSSPRVVRGKIWDSFHALFSFHLISGQILFIR
jgi:hypothetical protein